MDRVVRRAEGGHGRHGEGVAVGEDLRAQVVELEQRDRGHHRVHCGEPLARQLRALAQAGAFQQRVGVLPERYRAAVHCAGDVGGGSWELETCGRSDDAPGGARQRGRGGLRGIGGGLGRCGERGLLVDIGALFLFLFFVLFLVFLSVDGA